MRRIGWLINRLRVMSLREWIYRVCRFVFKELEHLFVLAGWIPKPKVTITPSNPLFGFDLEVCAEWGDLFELDYVRLDEILSGRLNLFGHDSLDIGRPVNWCRDPITGVVSPGRFGKKLNYRDDSVVGNVKFIWEIGRHQHLVPIAVAYVISGDVRYRQEIVEQIDTWIDTNAFGMGIHWCSSLEVSLRLISWAVVHSLLVLRDGGRGLFDAVKDSQRLGNSIYQQAWFVRYFLSRYSSANNHLIGELSGLWVSTQVFDLGNKGREWGKFAQEELEREAEMQVYKDGVNKEQAFYYHLWVLEYFLFVWMVGGRSGMEFSEHFFYRMLLMANFLRDVRPDGGEPPQFGDADDGFVVRFEPIWPDTPFGDLLDTLDCVFSHAEAIGQKAFWYRAMNRTQKVECPVAAWNRRYPVIYPDGGYTVLGGAGCHVVFDAGLLGYLGIAAHGHADALSFCLAVDGYWWLVDPGTYAYHSAPEWRSYFRGTAAHNTVRIGQRDQSKIAGPFMWSKKATAWIEKFEEDAGVQIASACHDGYQHIGVTHSRTLKFSPVCTQLELVDLLNVVDHQAVVAEIYYHFAPEVDIKWDSKDSCWVARCHGQEKILLVYTDQSWDFKLFKGELDPISGWYSPTLEEKVPTNTLRGVALISAPIKCLTRIVVR